MSEQVGVKSPEEVVIILLREGKGNEWFLMVTRSTKKIRFWEGLLTDSEEQYLTVIVKHTWPGLGDPVAPRAVSVSFDSARLQEEEEMAVPTTT